MKIAVTGGAGFIASQIADAYVAAGHEVIVIDDLSTGRRANIPSAAKFFRADIRSAEVADGARGGSRARAVRLVGGRGVRRAAAVPGAGVASSSPDLAVRDHQVDR
jgi:UDP-glucose 4-epimerase